jgi:hypothetical protein
MGRIALALPLALLADAAPARAQFEAVGARSLAMGGVGAAVQGEPWNGFDNPAALVGIERLWLGSEFRLSRFTTTRSFLPFGGESDRAFTDVVARPSFLGAAFPAGRAALQVHYVDGARRAGHYDFETYGRERGTLRSSLGGLGASAALGLGRQIGAGRRWSIGARATVLRARVVEDTSAHRDVPDAGGPIPFSFEGRQDASRYELGGALGLVVALGQRWTVGATYRLGSSMDVESTGVSSFPTLGLRFSSGFETEWSTPTMVSFGLAFRPTRRLLLTADLAGSDTPLFAYPAVCLGYPRPAPQSVCNPVLGNGVLAAEGSTVRTGAEWTLSRGATSIHLRAGARWGDYAAVSVGLGVTLGSRWRVDGAVLDTSQVQQAVLATSLEPRRQETARR